MFNYIIIIKLQEENEVVYFSIQKVIEHALIKRDNFEHGKT